MAPVMKKRPENKKPVKKPIPRADKTPTAAPGGNNQYLLYGVMALLFIFSLVAFSPMAKNGFIRTWDDGVYVIENQLLHDLSWQGIVNIFRYGDDFQKLINNYHPITILSLSVNYHISGLSPASYHITNMILHGINAILAFLFIYLLCRRRMWPAVIAGLLFAVHPMHVESVAWVSERKDVLYALFFLAGLIAYLKYLEDEKVWKLGVVLLLFLFSCLSKAMAAPFPFILLLIDYFRQRRLSLKMVLEKIPFFILAVIIGLMSVWLQSTSAIGKFETFTLFQRTMHASYGFIAYFVKFIVPSGLSAFYPYPAITPDGLLPLSFRIAPYIIILLAILVGWASFTKGEVPRAIVFGILFYFFTIALVLQFLSVGKAIMADRYTYLPYLGLSFILGMVIDYFLHRNSSVKYIGYALAAGALIICAVFSFLAHERTKVWKDDITLWSDALRQFPDGRMNFIYEKRAREYLEKNQFEAALADYQTIAADDPRNDNALDCMGRIYGKYYNDLGKSIENLEKAYKVNPKNPSVLKNLGVAMGMKGNFKRSLDYLLQAYQIDKADSNLLKNISATYSNLGMAEKSREFDQLIRALKPK